MDAGWHPYSSRFGDRYHSEFGGLDQARQVFSVAAICQLPGPMQRSGAFWKPALASA
jgi:hypothetical protein